jgi:polyisoprenoid-binding protein YceI
MKKLGFFISFTFLCAFALQAQEKYMTKVGHIHFYSHAKIEDIKADNNEVTSIINIKTGEMAFVVLMKSFKFDKALMEEHFNENYIESDKFPKAKFKGTITDIASIDLTKDTKYEVSVEGDLEIHGISKHITEKGTLEVNNGKISAKSVFTIAIKDFGIAIESALSDNIAETIEVTVEMLYEPMQ